MAAASLPEVAALDTALRTLQSQLSSQSATVRSARIVARCADDLEITAQESAPQTRKTLLASVAQAREAAQEARRQARQNALMTRTAMHEQLVGNGNDTSEASTHGAAQVARDINASLRRSTAMVTEEVARSEATGRVADASSRRLRQTRQQHGTYGSALRGGARTLADLKRSEHMANVVVLLCFVLFFVAAGYVSQRTLANSNTATFLVRPAGRVLFAPVRALARVARLVMGAPDAR